MDAVSSLLLMKVVVRVVPSALITDCGVNPAPLTVTIVFSLPAIVTVGVTDEIEGAGFRIVRTVTAVIVPLLTRIFTVLGEGGTAGAV